MNTHETPWPFGDLPMFGAGAIYADPPWSFENYSEKGEDRNATSHYDCMDLDAIKSLPVGQLASKDCALFLWVTNPMLPQGLEVMKAWGFTFKTVAFTWAKRSKLDTAWHMGLGYWTRQNTESCLLGVNGSPQRQSKGVRELLTEPRREHSRKPDRVVSDIEALVPGPYVELFARTERPGWQSWGNQVRKFEGVST